MAASPETLDRVKSILRTSLNLGPDEELADDMPLVGGEYDLDSLDILLFVTSVEKDLGVKIREASMDRTAFRSIRAFAEYVEASGNPR